MEVHETHEMVHHAAHGDGHGEEKHGSHARNIRIAVLISVIACLLSIVEIGGKSAQNASLSANIESANLWAFFQAKTIRMTATRSTAELLETMMPPDLPAARAEAWNKKIAELQATARRFDSEPETREGRKELMARAKEKEAFLARSLHAYHLYEYSAAAMQIGIVLASASAATGVLALAWLAGGVATVGTVIAVLAWLAPTAIHL